MFTITFIKYLLLKKIHVEKTKRVLKLGLNTHPTRQGLRPNVSHFTTTGYVWGIDHAIDFSFLNYDIDSVLVTKQ